MHRYLKAPMTRNFARYFLLHCKDHLNLKYNFFGRIFVTHLFVEIFNIIRYMHTVPPHLCAIYSSLNPFKYMKLFQKSCNAMSHVVLFAYPIKLNISTKNTAIKILPKKLYYDLSDLSNEIKKILHKISCHWNFKYF